MSKREYKAEIKCSCGWKKELSDEEYIDIVEGKKDMALGCGHWKYSGKITARHSVKGNDWRFGYGCTG